jgi:hypothetical protein
VRRRVDFLSRGLLRREEARYRLLFLGRGLRRRRTASAKGHGYATARRV